MGQHFWLCWRQDELSCDELLRTSSESGHLTGLAPWILSKSFSVQTEELNTSEDKKLVRLATMHTVKMVQLCKQTYKPVLPWARGVLTHEHLLASNIAPRY